MIFGLCDIAVAYFFFCDTLKVNLEPIFLTYLRCCSRQLKKLELNDDDEETFFKNTVKCTKLR